MTIIFDGSEDSFRQISSMLSSTAMTYHTPDGQPPYIELIDSGRIIDVGDTVALEIVINRNGSSVLSVVINDVTYTVKPKEFHGGYQCEHCCFEDESLEFCYNFKCSADERPDNRRFVYELIDIKEVE